MVIPLKDRKVITIINTFQKIIDDLIPNQAKYGYIKAANFIINQ